MKYFCLRSIVSILTACLLCYSEDFFVTAKYRTEGKHLRAELTMEIRIDRGRGNAAAWSQKVCCFQALTNTQPILSIISSCSHTGQACRFASRAPSSETTSYQSLRGLFAIGKVHWFADWPWPCFVFLCLVIALSWSWTNQYTDSALTADFPVIPCSLWTFDFSISYVSNLLPIQYQSHKCTSC